MIIVTKNYKNNKNPKQNKATKKQNPNENRTKEPKQVPS